MSSARLYNTKMASNSEHNKLSLLVVQSFVVHDGQLNIRGYCLQKLPEEGKLHHDSSTGTERECCLKMYLAEAAEYSVA